MARSGPEVSWDLSRVSLCLRFDSWWTLSKKQVLKIFGHKLKQNNLSSFLKIITCLNNIFNASGGLNYKYQNIASQELDEPENCWNSVR